MDIFQMDYFFAIFAKILKYLPVTMYVALCSLVLSLIIGFFLALIRQYRVKILYPLSNLYVSFFRGTPFIAQLFLFYYGFAQFSETIKKMTPFVAMLVVLSINFSAFMCENIRAAINSVEKGQFEAALSVGMTPAQALCRIVVPQAARVAIPGLSNSFINLFKSTAVGFVIGLKDMMAGANLEISRTFRYLECYTAVIIIYWALISVFSYFQSIMEKRLNRAY